MRESVSLTTFIVGAIHQSPVTNPCRGLPDQMMACKMMASVLP